jgi:hypothetical protein
LGFFRVEDGWYVWYYSLTANIGGGDPSCFLLGEAAHSQDNNKTRQRKFGKRASRGDRIIMCDVCAGRSVPAAVAARLDRQARTKVGAPPVIVDDPSLPRKHTEPSEFGRVTRPRKSARERRREEPRQVGQAARPGIARSVSIDEAPQPSLPYLGRSIG